jgi:hypothetical protein
MNKLLIISIFLLACFSISCGEYLTLGFHLKKYFFNYFSGMKKLILISILLISFNLSAQFTAIPDANFEQTLVTHGIDTDGIVNGQMATVDALGVTTLIVGNKNISDLTGIEAFTSLTTLDATQNQLTILDLSALTTVQLITVWGNNLTNIDITTNTSLQTLYINDNQLTSIDISNNLLIDELFCENNFITSLDLSNHSVLVDLFCENNSLTCLNVKNGNNTNFNFFDATNNPNLTCIEVDNVTWSTSSWTITNGNIDAGMSFSTNCGSPCAVGIEEFNLSTVSIYPNPSSSQITISTDVDYSEIQIYNVMGKIEIIVQSPANVIDISKLNNGVYFLKFSREEKSFTKKFIKK